MNLLLRKIFLICVIAVLSISFTSYSLSDAVQTTQSTVIEIPVELPENFTPNSNSLITQEIEQHPILPSRSSPQSRKRWYEKIVQFFLARLEDLGRRGSCSNLSPPLIAFMPPPPADEESRVVLAEGLESALALTVSDYPTFWFYVPKELKDIEFAEFMMQNERDEDVLENPIKVYLKTSGIVSFKLPSREDPLEVNKPYHWYFSVLCDSERPSRNPSIDGWIERVQLETSREELAAVTPRGRFELYASKDIWHETLEFLAEQRCRYRQNPLYVEYWDAILQAVVGEVNRDKIDPLSYCSSHQQLRAVYDI